MSPPVSRSYPGRTLHYDGASGSARRIEIPVESPVNIVYGGMPYAVMMATPADIEDFVVGFSLTEGVIKGHDEIRGLDIREQGDGWVVSADLVADALRRHLARRRNLSGRTSCGLCGVESLDQIPAASEPVHGQLVRSAAIDRALRSLDDHQPLYQATRAVHAAAWCDSDGTILIVREDVGRHNALDKMIGACMRAGLSARDGFVVITSRCSFEMIEKTAIFGAANLVAVSAPTSLAIERASALGVTLIAIARRDSAVVFTALPDSGSHQSQFEHTLRRRPDVL